MERHSSSSAKWPPKVNEESAPARPKPNMVDMLRNREMGGRMLLTIQSLGVNTKAILNDDFNRMLSSISDLEKAIQERNIAEIEQAVAQMLTRMVDPTGSESPYDISPRRKLEREMFVSLGGLNALVALIGPPLSGYDARLMASSHVESKIEYWNEILVLLREICYSVPNLADNTFTNQHIAFLFTLLSHKVVFENTVNLIEEILAVKVDTFDLMLVPQLYLLIDSFNPRHLMHFCRILALVLFESEDRQIMENAQVLRSLDLLQLRRDRMAKGTNIVERNQSLIVEMPKLLEKFIILFRVVNYGPELSKLVRHHIFAQAPGDIYQYSPISSSGGPQRGEWELLRHLDEITTIAAAPAGRRAGNALDPADTEVTDQLLTAFAATDEASNSMHSIMGRIFSIMEVADALGVASFSNLNVSAVGVPALMQKNRAHYTYREAKNLLQFQSMLLVPHQVELLFVLCTLLSGRWKIEVQGRLADLGIVDCFYDMYDRLSWGQDLERSNSGPEHIHGPSCECSPESAIRVQYLRLVHNFYDRDFVDNPNKNLLLSPSEIELIQNRPDQLISGKFYVHSANTGLLARISATLLLEPTESIYRFWLASCLESFLRGSNKRHQVFVANTGVVRHIVSHILAIGVKTSNNLQTAFDLLGEIVKFNRVTLEIFEACFDDNQFRDFMNIAMENLVDSNVFIRSLFLSMESISSCSFVKGKRDTASCVDVESLFNSKPTYLTHSWIQTLPTVASTRALRRISSKKQRKCAASVVTPGRIGTRDGVGIEGGGDGSSTATNDALSSIRKGVMGVFRDIHSVASSLVSSGMGGTPSISLETSPLKQDSPSSPNPSSSSPQTSPLSPKALSSPMMSCPQGAVSPSIGWSLPDSLFRTSLFLANEREKILVRLMSIVSLHSVNHENICCLNTSLLVFLLSHRKGHLARLLRNVREQAIVINSALTQSGDPGVFENYRRLLWYWQEYYLRRGRDRLSLEFSSHIPFHHWNEIVNRLTQDDGSETSLLSAPVRLPMSPYVFSPRPVCSTSEFIQNHTRPKYSVPISSAFYDAVD